MSLIIEPAAPIIIPPISVPFLSSDDCLPAPCNLPAVTAVNPLFNPSSTFNSATELPKVPVSLYSANIDTEEDSEFDKNQESSDQEDMSLPGQLLPLDPKTALGVMTVRFYSKVGVQQLKADVRATLEHVDDPADFVLQIIINMRLKPFNKKRGHFRVFPKLLLRVLAIYSPPISEKNKVTAKEVLQILENNTFGKKTVNKLKAIFKIDSTVTTSPPTLDFNEPYLTAKLANQSLQTGYNPLFSTE